MKKWSIFIGLFIAGLIALGGYLYFNKSYVTSNALFVKSDRLVFLSFKRVGEIEKFYVNEGDRVKKGDILVKLDTKELVFNKKLIENDIKALSKEIEAKIIEKKRLKESIENELSILSSKIAQTDYFVKSLEYRIKAKVYELAKLEDDYKRFLKLFKEKKISKEEFEKIKVSYFMLKEEIKAQKALFLSKKEDLKILNLKKKDLEKSKINIKRYSKIVESLNFKREALKEKLALINQSIKDSYLYAPFNGIIAKKFLDANEIAKGKVLSIVDLNSLYALDLIEEKKLRYIKPGCKAFIYIDAVDKEYKGVVKEILPASAATFALIPRDISSGEFTKLSQRFYLKISFVTPPKELLVGMSGEVKIEKCK